MAMNLPSYVHGASETPLIGETIGVYFDQAVERFGGRDALIVRHQGIRWSWRALKERVDGLAAGLIALGLEPGARIGIWSPNNAEWVVTQFATARLGLVLVNINPAYRLAELEYALNKVGCRALIAAQEFKTSRYLDMLQELAPELATAQPGALKSQRLPTLQMVLRLGEHETAGMLSYRAVVAAGERCVKRERLQSIGDTLDCHEPINIQFTSGTTGQPKGATLTHHNIVNNARFIARAMRFTEHDSLCIPVPLYHCFGMVLAVLASVSSGAAMVFPGEAFEPAATLRAVADERCTALHGVPTMFIAARSRGFCAIRFVLATHRHHGRFPVSDRNHEARRVA